MGCCSTVKVAYVHGDAQEMATTYAHTGEERGEWKVPVGVVPDLLIPLLLGQDWPGFPRELPATRRMRRPLDCTSLPQDVCLIGEHEEAKDYAAEGESHTTSNPLSFVFKQVTCKGNFGQGQKQEEQLENCGGQVRFIEGKDQQPGQPVPSLYFLVHQGLLSQHTEW